MLLSTLHIPCVVALYELYRSYSDRSPFLCVSQKRSQRNHRGYFQKLMHRAAAKPTTLHSHKNRNSRDLMGTQIYESLCFGFHVGNFVPTYFDKKEFIEYLHRRVWKLQNVNVKGSLVVVTLPSESNKILPLTVSTGTVFFSHNRFY